MKEKRLKEVKFRKFLKPITYDLREVVVVPNKKHTKKVEIGNIENAIFQSLITDLKSKQSFFLINLRIAKQSL